jgi:hypothetical protein
MASLGEETRASCRGPSNHNAVALILPHKSMLSFDGGAIGADIYTDRTGVICRSVVDCARVIDALVGSKNDYYDQRDPFTTVPRSSILATPYVSHLSTRGTEGTLQGLRIGVVRESLIIPNGSVSERPIVTAANTEIKAILRDHLGATLVQSNDPQAENDPEIETMGVDFKAAVARLVPIFMPDILFRLGADGQPVYKEVAEAIIPTPFVAGGMPSLASPTVSAGAEATYQPPKIFGSGKMKPIDYCVALAEGKIKPPGTRNHVQISHPAISDTTIGRMGKKRVHRDTNGFRRAQCTFQILGRRSARCVFELGRTVRSAQSVGRTAGRERTHHAPRTSASDRYDGSAREQT